MTQVFSIKSGAMLCVATLAMCFAGQEANAQCGGGFGGFSPGFGGTSIAINRGGVSFGYSSGFRGIGYGGFGAPVNLYRGGIYGGGGFYGRPYSGINFNYVAPRPRPYGYYGGGRGHGHGHRRF